MSKAKHAALVGARMEAPERGWIIGTLGGEPAYSDECAVFLGVREGRQDSTRGFNGFSVH